MNFYQSEYPAVYRGKVEANNDPRNLGRCRIRVPSVHGELNYPVELIPWARPVAPTTINSNRGSFNIPDIGDIVWVMFEGSNKDYPVYLGGTYALSDIPIDNSRVVIYVEGDNAIVYDRTNKSYSINIGDNSIDIKDDSIHIGNLDKYISLNKNRVSIKSKDNYLIASNESIVLQKGTNLLKVTDSDIEIVGNVKIVGDLEVKKDLLVDGDYPCRAE